MPPLFCDPSWFVSSGFHISRANFRPLCPPAYMAVLVKMLVAALNPQLAARIERETRSGSASASLLSPESFH